MLKPYDDYIDTEISWVPIAPAHWEMLRAKYMFSKESRPVAPSDKVVTCFRDGTVTLRENRRTTGFTESVNETGYQGVRCGDLVLHVMDAFAGAIGVSDSNGKCTPVYSCCTSKGNYNHYYYAFLLREMARAGYIQSLYRRIRERSSDFRFDVFAQQFLLIPPRPEQDQIVRFLDWKTSEMAHFIKEKKREIRRLHELKRAITNKAVTRGLHDNVPMKETGIEWMPHIPAHWDVCPLRQFLFSVSEKNHPDMPLLSVTREQGVIQRDVEDFDTNHNYIPDDLSGYKLVRKGQFVINKMKAWQGSYGVSEYDGIVSPAYFIFNLRFPNKKFFHFAMRSRIYVNFFAQFSDGIRTGQWDLSMQKMKHIPFFVPSEEEQEEILRVVPAKIAEIDAMIAALNEEIALVQELRTKTVADVATGKIDVRNVEIPRFEVETEEPTDEEDADEESGEEDTEETDDNVDEEVDE